MSRDVANAHTLCLHYLDDAPAPRRLALTPAQLRTVVARQRERGRTAVSLDAFGRRGDNGEVGTAHFALSFDDAHRSLYDLALPLLRALDVPATLFVPTAYVGTSDEFLSWDALRALRDAGWALGSHTVSHPRMGWRLYDETAEAYAARLFAECARSREVMERELGTEIALFAYPFGEAPPAAREAVRRAGYRAAFTVSDALAWDGDLLAIPRLDGMEAEGFVAPARTGDQGPIAISVVVPACDRVEILGEVVRRLAAQSYPRERYEVLVVDDGSREDLAPLFADVAPNVRLIARAGEASRFRAGQARQRGADEARFETVAFLDADVVVGPDFLWHLDWVHSRVGRAVVLGYLSGYNLHDLGFVHTLDSVRDAADPDASLAKIPDRSREPVLRACLDNLDWLAEPWRLAYTGNLSLPRSLLAEVGGFATEFEGWGLEDIDLGYRLFRAGARWVFSRFAVGYHLVDPDEPAPRNPFRKLAPVREDFARYVQNLATLQRRNAGDPAIERFAEQTLRDVDETCSRPHTVGIELGGEDSLAGVYRRVMHRCQPGGVATHEALDRVAYARKVGARQLYVLGGEPAEHPGFLAILRAAREAGIPRVVVETNATPFADPDLVSATRAEGLDHAVVRVFAFDAERFEQVTQRPGSYARFAAGYAALGRAGVYRSARLVLTPETDELLEASLDRLEGDGVRVDEVSVLAPELLADVTARVARRAARAGASAPPPVRGVGS